MDVWKILFLLPLVWASASFGQEAPQPDAFQYFSFEDECWAVTKRTPSAQDLNTAKYQFWNIKTQNYEGKCEDLNNERDRVISQKVLLESFNDNETRDGIVGLTYFKDGHNSKDKNRLMNRGCWLGQRSKNDPQWIVCGGWDKRTDDIRQDRLVDAYSTKTGWFTRKVIVHKVIAPVVVGKEDQGNLGDYKAVGPYNTNLKNVFDKPLAPPPEPPKPPQEKIVIKKETEYVTQEIQTYCHVEHNCEMYNKDLPSDPATKKAYCQNLFKDEYLYCLSAPMCLSKCEKAGKDCTARQCLEQLVHLYEDPKDVSIKKTYTTLDGIVAEIIAADLNYRKIQLRKDQCKCKEKVTDNCKDATEKKERQAVDKDLIPAKDRLDAALNSADRWQAVLHSQVQARVNAGETPCAVKDRTVQEKFTTIPRQEGWMDRQTFLNDYRHIRRARTLLGYLNGECKKYEPQQDIPQQPTGPSHPQRTGQRTQKSNRAISSVPDKK